MANSKGKLSRSFRVASCSTETPTERIPQNQWKNVTGILILDGTARMEHVRSP